MIVEVEKVQQDIEYECVAMRGRPVDGSDYSGEVEQRLELNLTGNANTLTGVQKDNLVLETERHAISTNGTEIRDADIETDPYTLAYEDGEYIYFIRIRKLTPRECWRLMGFSDRDFDKAQVVNSNTQLYKQAGNSIVKNVLTAVMGQLFEGCENRYKETAYE